VIGVDADHAAGASAAPEALRGLDPETGGSGLDRINPTCGVWPPRDRLQPYPPRQSAPPRGDGGSLSSTLTIDVANCTAKILKTAQMGSSSLLNCAES